MRNLSHFFVSMEIACIIFYHSIIYRITNNSISLNIYWQFNFHTPIFTIFQKRLTSILNTDYHAYTFVFWKRQTLPNYVLQGHSIIIFKTQYNTLKRISTLFNSFRYFLIDWDAFQMPELYSLPSTAINKLKTRPQTFMYNSEGT